MTRQPPPPFDPAGRRLVWVKGAWYAADPDRTRRPSDHHDDDRRAA